MTEHELQALVDLLNRTPLSRSEALWVQQLMARLAAEIKAKAGRQYNASETP
ncbi:MAG: hypothetical protein IPM41_06320 [Sphingomonadales bacterium]|nr:hypothetical protein [Sphingomonadales bacterium]